MRPKECETVALSSAWYENLDQPDCLLDLDLDLPLFQLAGVRAACSWAISQLIVRTILHTTVLATCLP
jgi:hypothetical protein